MHVEAGQTGHDKKTFYIDHKQRFGKNILCLNIFAGNFEDLWKLIVPSVFNIHVSLFFYLTAINAALNLMAVVEGQTKAWSVCIQIDLKLSQHQIVSPKPSI